MFNSFVVTGGGCVRNRSDNVIVNANAPAPGTPSSSLEVGALVC